jgi:hypothetical protein
MVPVENLCPAQTRRTGEVGDKLSRLKTAHSECRENAGPNAPSSTCPPLLYFCPYHTADSCRRLALPLPLKGILALRPPEFSVVTKRPSDYGPQKGAQTNPNRPKHPAEGPYITKQKHKQRAAQCSYGQMLLVGLPQPA